VFDEVGDWIWQAQFKPLMRWHNQLEAGWETLKNYFEWRVTTSLSEGINNVIKSIKRRGFGYRNMQYFKLKIMQVCGYLNSKFIPTAVQ
jgi:transposase